MLDGVHQHVCLFPRHLEYVVRPSGLYAVFACPSGSSKWFVHGLLIRSRSDHGRVSPHFLEPMTSQPCLLRCCGVRDDKLAQFRFQRKLIEAIENRLNHGLEEEERRRGRVS